MKSIGELARAAEKAIRNKRWSWSRRWNGFSDMPLWRLIAAELDMPIHQVLAFVGRLDEFANAAEQRGQVDHFRAAEFGVALGMSADDAQRIFAALEREKWVEWGAVADFFVRNRDEEKDDQNIRQQRSRDRKRALQLLVKLERLGRIGKTEHLELMVGLKELTDPQLASLLVELRQLELSTGAPVTSVTSDRVTVTPEQIIQIQARPVDNSGDSARGAEAGLPEEGVAGAASDPQAASRLWIETEGLKLIVERMDWPLTRASLAVARWLDQQLEGDAAALALILQTEEARGYIGPRFHTDVTDAIARHVRQKIAGADPQGKLPLGGVRKVS